MDPNKFTYSTQEVIAKAVNLALENGNPEVTVWHLFASLINDSSGIISQILEKEKVSLSLLQEKIDEKIAQLPKIDKQTSQPLISSSLLNLFRQADKIAASFKDTYLSREHLFLALFDDEQIKTVLLDLKLDKNKIKEIIMTLRGNQKADSQNPEDKYNILQKYTVNFTSLAQKGKLDPVIGRDNEIRRVMQVLSRRTKNNPVLLGDPGVGKTAIVEGLAQRIISGDVPDNLREKQLLALDLPGLLAGAKFRGEFEERLKTLLSEIEKNSDKYVLFLDELHTLVGAGAAEGAIDASNMLKPALARGLLHAIGATTVSEYRKYIEKDAALERRFQPVYIGEPSTTDTIAILRGLKEKYETHHGIRITDDALIAAAALSKRYITDRFLPDKAIDLIDEAAAGLKIETQSMPYDLDVLKRKVMQKEIEAEALKKDEGKESEGKRKILEKEIADLKEKQRELNIVWKNQKELLVKLQDKRAKLESLKLELEKAERDVQLEKAAEIKYGKIPQINKEIKNLETKWNQIPQEKRLLPQEVSEEDIARVVARWTRIPVARLLKSESDKLSHLEEVLNKRVVGQKDALESIAKAVRRNRAGLTEGRKPIGTFLFLGPTGVGKTETAKALAEAIFNSESALIRIDMTEYQESHSVARLIGAPPGYVGYEEGGQLTEAVRRKPYSVVLFDEVEKANEQIFNLFLQIFDDGRLTDGRGRTVDFTNTVIIMTSNLGSEVIAEYEGKKDLLNSKMWEVLRGKFRPEFLNRIDRIVIFNSLDKELIRQIVDLQLDHFRKRLLEKGILVSFTKAVGNYLGQIGFDPVYGARPLKRMITEKIEDELAALIIDHKIDKGDSLEIDYNKGKIVVNKKE